jgi:hypothetical protein
VALAVLYVSFFLSGTLAGLKVGLGPGKLPSEFFVQAHFILVIPLSLGSLWFCSADAKLAGKTLVEMARLGIFFLWPVGVPVYLLWARSIRGLGILLLHGLPLCLIWISSGAATILLVSAE